MVVSLPEKSQISGSVSVCLPVFNGAQFVAEAIESILNQDFDDFELIITNNASTDKTNEIVQKYARADSRVRSIRNEKNIGAAENYNLGFQHSRGEYVKWCAHDDLISSDFLRQTVDLLDAEPETSIAFGLTQLIDACSQLIGSENVSEMEENLSDDPAVRFFRSITGFVRCYPIFGLFRAADLQRFTMHRRYYGSDRALLSDLNLFGKLRVAPNVVFYYRQHDNQSVRLNDPAQRSIWQNGVFERALSLQRLTLLRHLFEVAGRHEDLASPLRLRWQVAKYAARPIELGRLGFEAVQAVSPDAARKLRPFAAGFFHGVIKPRR